MARRALKPLTPLLVGLVAVVLGLLAIGTSFAGTGSGPGGVAPVDGPGPAKSKSVPVSPAATVSVRPAVSPAPSASSVAVPSSPPATDGNQGKIEYGPKDCASCMGPPIN